MPGKHVAVLMGGWSAEREVSLEAQVTLLRHRIDQLELRLAAIEKEK